MFVDEFVSCIEPDLGAEANYLDYVCVLSSELLDIGSFPIANWSIRSPHPHQLGFVGR